MTEGSYVFEVFYYSYNHDWEIANGEFTDGHDGVLLNRYPDPAYPEEHEIQMNANLHWCAAPDANNHYQLPPGCPATADGVVLPKDLLDPQRPANDARPDIGPAPLGAEMPNVERHGRIKSPILGNSF
ncbi:MAG: hypothetical protein FJ302_16060 [Planctomycetes bacterium]|nr:hypothetical protein [Planctomycetota bacterium]